MRNAGHARMTKNVWRRKQKKKRTINSAMIFQHTGNNFIDVKCKWYRIHLACDDFEAENDRQGWRTRAEGSCVRLHRWSARDRRKSQRTYSTRIDERDPIRVENIPEHIGQYHEFGRARLWKRKRKRKREERAACKTTVNKESGAKQTEMRWNGRQRPKSARKRETGHR